LTYAIHSRQRIVYGVLTPGTAYHTAQTCKAQFDWLAGMDNWPMTPERLHKHVALVVSGEAEVRALLDAGINEYPEMYDGDDDLPDPDKLQDIICPLCQ